MEKLMRAAIERIFWLYRTMISPAFQVGFGIRCRFEESCSAYFERALHENGLGRGTILGIRRILACSKWSGTQKHG
jgi:putative component of membrane protein insertase Oxa1/YidC/SpoIIIJ protein YidD